MAGVGIVMFMCRRGVREEGNDLWTQSSSAILGLFHVILIKKRNGSSFYYSKAFFVFGGKIKGQLPSLCKNFLFLKFLSFTYTNLYLVKQDHLYTYFFSINIF